MVITDMRGANVSFETVKMMSCLHFTMGNFYDCIQVKLFLLVFHSVIPSIRSSVDDFILLIFQKFDQLKFMEIVFDRFKL